MIQANWEKIKRWGEDVLLIGGVAAAVVLVVGVYRLNVGRMESAEMVQFEEDAFISGIQDIRDQTQYPFVASKRGEKYYPKACAAAGRINVENRIYFPSEHAAIDAGFARAKNC